MKESVVKSLIQLFALIANIYDSGVSGVARSVLESYLRRRINHELTQKYVAYFDELIRNRLEQNQLKGFDVHKVKQLCQEVNAILHQKEKVIVFVRLVEFVNENNVISAEENRFITLVAQLFNLHDDELEAIKIFSTANRDTCFKDPIFLTVDCLNYTALKNDAVSLPKVGIAADELVLDTVKYSGNSYFRSKHIFSRDFPGKVVVLHIASVHTFFYRYFGNAVLFFNNRTVLPNQTFVFDHGGIIKGAQIRPIYYSDIAAFYAEKAEQYRISLTVRNAAFNFRNSPNGIQPFSMREVSGQFIGIMGGSGTGKSTLLNMLNGKLPLSQGEILINGFNIHKYKFEGIIGYVPQDDLLIEELTVFQNLYLNAKLSLSNHSQKRLLLKVVKTLKDFDLFAIRDLQVGTPLKKKISGGQRKRLNIALEMIREPSILYVDEPTSGLSSADSESMMLLLKAQTLNNKLVFANIHQPSSDIFKLLDKLIVLDKGGRLIYYGNPLDALVYFKTTAEYINSKESECPTCGNVNPEQILNIVELKEVDEFGRFTENRRISPETWHSFFIEKEAKKKRREPIQRYIPKQVFVAPSYWAQFKIFICRDVLTKLSNLQYLSITFAEAPVLALILAFFTKYIAGTPENPHAYLFIENSNLPAYLFMAVVVSLFLGLTVSAEEIIHDRRILERESFLDLSRFSYINSKIVLLLTISAIQMASFVLVANTILEIQGLNFQYWAILFSCSALANFLGLNISSGLNSVVSIYISIPFLLVPQLLLSGTIVNFDRLNENFANQEVTPILGDIMPSRWAYEALAVTQFRDNLFTREVFSYEVQMSSADYVNNFVISQLESKLDMVDLLRKTKRKPLDLQNNLHLIRNEFHNLAQKSNQPDFAYLDQLTADEINETNLQAASNFLSSQKTYFIAFYDSIRHLRELQLSALSKRLREQNSSLSELKQDHYNKQLANYLTNRFELVKSIEYNHRFVRKKDPIYMLPSTHSGRAHFYAPYKRVGSMYFDTIWFNIFVMWFMAGILYLTLYFDTLRYLLDTAFGFVRKFSFARRG